MSKHKTLWAALLVMLLWGTLFPMAKLAFAAYEVSGMADILLFAGIRFVICGGVICVFASAKDADSYRAAGRSILPVLLSGAIAVALHYFFLYVGLEQTDSAKTALIKQFGSLFYVCFSFLFIKEDKPTLRKIISAVVGFLGIIALNVDGGGISFSVGDLLILCASFCTVFANVISKKVFAKVAPITATGISQLFGGVVLLIAGLCMGGDVRFTLDADLWIMVYVCAASVVSYCVWFGTVKKGELSQLFIIKFAEPVFACLFGAWLLDEDIWNLRYLIAFLLIGASIVFSNKKASEKKQAP